MRKSYSLINQTDKLAVRNSLKARNKNLLFKGVRESCLVKQAIQAHLQTDWFDL